MTRRLLLHGLILSLWSSMAAAAEHVTRAIIGRSPAAPLSSAERDSLVAFGEVVVDGRALSPAEQAYLVEHLTESTGSDADRLSLYRTTARLLDRLAGGSFAGLEMGERAELVARHRLAVQTTTPDDDAGALDDDVRAVRTRTVPDLVRAYWGSPAGWAAVGYQQFPGRCGDLARYTRREG
jgi:hypothetical protein